jgi:uncharacterized protein (TIGR02145 family)
MKKNIFLILLIAAITTNLQAQVTIGGDYAPKDGAILDLNSKVKGGLLLSNVFITDLDRIPFAAGIFSGVTEANDDVNPDLAGMVVYNTNETTGKGLYIWDGDKWNHAMVAPCTPVSDVTMIPSAPQTVIAGTAIQFSVSVTPGSAPTYNWYISSDGGSTYGASLGTGNTYIFPAAQAVGSYVLKAVVDNDCTTDPGIAVTVPVTVQPDDAGPYPTPGTYKLSGKNCLDVWQTDHAAGSPCMPKDSRKNDFLGGYAFTYTFTGAPADDLTYVYTDGSSIVSSVSGNGTTTCTLTFKPEVIAAATGKTKDNALKVTLYALFKVGADCYKESLEISIQDCACGCPAKISASEWLTFQCHNLGGQDIYTGTTVGREHHGDWYRFGAKNPSMLNTAAHDTDDAWDDESYQTGFDDWFATNNPCPSGYRLPTYTEWDNVLSNNTQSTQGTWTSGSFNAVRKFGDYLYLPAAGYRYSSSGALIYLGTNGLYWSSSADSPYGRYMYFNSSSAFMTTTYRDYGFSCRCVSE